MRIFSACLLVFLALAACAADKITPGIPPVLENDIGRWLDVDGYCTDIDRLDAIFLIGGYFGSEMYSVAWLKAVEDGICTNKTANLKFTGCNRAYIFSPTSAACSGIFENKEGNQIFAPVWVDFYKKEKGTNI